ncbi:hypothetical protein HZH68_010706 [Vespula germanica]|uniref:Uncharacterized protein n=1 Tax=Vespula germanica TaxID=30212 RepID=A0A834N2F6_VESGE|nr:hypothetical protein HZH68_010706 [Vespula germanica]
MESWLKSESTSEDDRHASSSRLQSASCLHSCLELARPARCFRRLASAGDSLEASMGKFCCVMGFGLSTKKEEVEEKEEEEEEEGEEEDGKMCIVVPAGTQPDGNEGGEDEEDDEEVEEKEEEEEEKEDVEKGEEECKGGKSMRKCVSIGDSINKLELGKISRTTTTTTTMMATSVIPSYLRDIPFISSNYDCSEQVGNRQQVERVAAVAAALINT